MELANVQSETMIKRSIPHVSHKRRISAWLIHLFTASAAILGLYTLYAIYQHDFILAFWLMGATIFIDSVDGSLARYVGVKIAAPKIDGALLDNIVDYLNYVMTPAFFILVSQLIPDYWGIAAASAMVLASAYQFTQADAKTSDHFFKGFPSYWNLAAFYLFIANMPSWFNLVVIAVLALLIFIPIKYIYLTRIENVSRSRALRMGLIITTLIYAFATFMLLAIYPDSNKIYVTISWAFGILYVSISLYRTFNPLSLPAGTTI